MKGIFAVNKPKGPTSNDIVQIIKRENKGEKVGHAGTLDPLASGVLVIAVGRESTKKIADQVKKEKEYIAKIKLGQNSTTDDEEGEKENIEVGNNPNLDDVKKILPKFIGKIMQIPPIYSAIKIKGKEAYKYARKGQELEMKGREVEIKNIKILDYSWPILEINVVCGPGVYIRSLSRDIGKELKTGGYLADLQRTRVGDYTIEKAIEIKGIK
ncbi:MAG: tRNA pseudouridine(55) synthase TruB [Patescibacteria group bacterium]|nr:tRNA pseudouridine(55) synthase TruB [Patescibacteria group bacterium]